MKPFIFSLLLLFLLSCRQEVISLGERVSDTFFLRSNGASMRVLVEGSTASKTFLLCVHGGPGSSSFFFNSEFISTHLEDTFAVVYWDQRNAGASQGGANAEHLTLPQMTEDLEKLVAVLKLRYGQDISIFVMGHSFGGLLSTSFFAKAGNQEQVTGWIFVDGSHQYLLNDTLTRDMLLAEGRAQLALGNHPAEWQRIVDYCEAHPGPFDMEVSSQLNSFAHDAETYYPEVEYNSILQAIREHAIKYNWPILPTYLNNVFSGNAPFNRDLREADFRSGLARVTVPTLLMFGQRDFICPPGHGDDLMARIGSAHKFMVISPVSGHTPMFQDEAWFCSEVRKFMREFR